MARGEIIGGISTVVLEGGKETRERSPRSRSQIPYKRNYRQVLYIRDIGLGGSAIREH